MNKLFKSAIVAVGLTGAACALGGTASAAGIAIDFGNVAIGYSDGYWDTGHHWHRWNNARDARAYRMAHRDHYHGWRHDDRHHHDGWH